jgi:hypothetical protein
MRGCLLLLLISYVGLTSGCAHVPEAAGGMRGTPRISWVIMSGDRDNPDRDWVCQSDMQDDCVVPASRPGDEVFSDVHVYYHGVGPETTYTGSFHVGYFQGSAASNRVQTNITVRKDGAISNQSVIGLVTSSPGRYEVAFDHLAASSGASSDRPIQHLLPVVVK